LAIPLLFFFKISAPLNFCDFRGESFRHHTDDDHGTTMQSASTGGEGRRGGDPLPGRRPRHPPAARGQRRPGFSLHLSLTAAAGSGPPWRVLSCPCERYLLQLPVEVREKMQVQLHICLEFSIHDLKVTSVERHD
jgi:hypothetical protein